MTSLLIISIIKQTHQCLFIDTYMCKTDETVSWEKFNFSAISLSLIDCSNNLTISFLCLSDNWIFFMFLLYLQKQINSQQPHQFFVVINCKKNIENL